MYDELSWFVRRHHDQRTGTDTTLDLAGVTSLSGSDLNVIASGPGTVINLSSLANLQRYERRIQRDRRRED